MLHLNDVTLRVAGRPLLEGATLHLPAGQRFGLVGRNGSGTAGRGAARPGAAQPASARDSPAAARRFAATRHRATSPWACAIRTSSWARVRRCRWDSAVAGG